MKVVQINTTCGAGSTGKICVAVSKLLTAKNIENYILYTSGKSDYPLGIKFAGDKYKKVQALKSRILGNYGFNSNYATRKLIKELERIQPDIIHIHNIHSHDCNLSILFNYIKQKNIKVFWTFHDCWSFTANCTHFTMVKCDKWKVECEKCPQIKQTSWFVDRSKTLFKRKKELFKGLDMTIITPSQWLADLVKESFFKEYPIKVVNNGINLDIFKPVQSSFRKKYGIEDKFILLGVAFGWGKRKGLDVFIELAKRLDDKYQIVLVGTDENVDKQLPKNIISIHRTQNQAELVAIYTAADLFVNPTREENYPTVNMESIACGTPVITFKTGGSPEMLNETCGVVVECDDVDALEQEIMYAFVNRNLSVEDNMAEHFDEKERYKEYAKLYIK